MNTAINANWFIRGFKTLTLWRKEILFGVGSANVLKLSFLKTGCRCSGQVSSQRNPSTVGDPHETHASSCEGNVWLSWLWPQISSLLSPTKQRCCWNIGLRPGATSRDSKLYDDCMLNHCVGLSASLPALHSQVKATLPTPADTLEHRIKPGDWVVSKDFRRTHWKQRRFTGPF